MAGPPPRRRGTSVPPRAPPRADPPPAQQVPEAASTRRGQPAVATERESAIVAVAPLVFARGDFAQNGWMVGPPFLTDAGPAVWWTTTSMVRGLKYIWPIVFAIGIALVLLNLPTRDAVIWSRGPLPFAPSMVLAGVGYSLAWIAFVHWKEYTPDAIVFARDGRIVRPDMTWDPRTPLNCIVAGVLLAVSVLLLVLVGMLPADTPQIWLYVLTFSVASFALIAFLFNIFGRWTHSTAETTYAPRWTDIVDWNSDLSRKWGWQPTLTSRDNPLDPMEVFCFLTNGQRLVISRMNVTPDWSNQLTTALRGAWQMALDQLEKDEMAGTHHQAHDAFYKAERERRIR